MPHDGDQVAVAPCLDPNDTIAVLGVLVGDTLDQPRQHLDRMDWAEESDVTRNHSESPAEGWPVLRGLVGTFSGTSMPSAGYGCKTVSTSMTTKTNAIAASRK